MSKRPVLLDTHVWVWLVTARTDHVDAPAQRELKNASDEGRLLVSAISVWEIGMLVAKDRLTLPMDVYEWTDRALAAPGLQLVQLEPEIALDSTRLENAPTDPADRILIATARRMRAALMTADRKIVAYANKTGSIHAMSVA